MVSSTNHTKVSTTNLTTTDPLVNGSWLPNPLPGWYEYINPIDEYDIFVSRILVLMDQNPILKKNIAQLNLVLASRKRNIPSRHPIKDGLIRFLMSVSDRHKQRFMENLQSKRCFFRLQDLYALISFKPSMKATWYSPRFIHTREFAYID